jgi:GNAT superfamily N-acetyltransferase
MRPIVSHREQCEAMGPLWIIRTSAAPEGLVPTGEVMNGLSKPQVYNDPQGARWLGKPAKYEFPSLLDHATSQLQQRSGLPAAETHTTTLDNRPASVQRMFDADPAFPDHRVDIGSMDPNDVLELQKHMAFDWAISNHDAHSGNFLRDRNTGGIVGIDKGQAFKYFGQDQLSHNFGQDLNPPLNPNVPVYSQMWRQHAQGQGQLHDPRTGPLGEYIQGLQNIPDDEWREHLRPYAQSAAGSGKLSMGDPEAFLDAAVARKNSLANDFGSLYDRVNSRRTGGRVVRPKARSARNDQVGVGGRLPTSEVAKYFHSIITPEDLDPDFDADVRANGVHTPIEISTDGNRAAITEGHHRTLSAQGNGHPDVPVHIYRVPSAHMLGRGGEVGEHLRSLLSGYPEAVFREASIADLYPQILAPGGQPYTADYFRAIGEQVLARDPELRAKAIAWQNRMAGADKGDSCKYCDNEAVWEILHSEGMAYIPVCDDHLKKGQKAAEECTPDGSRDPDNIVRITKIATAPVVEDTDFEEDEEAPYEPDFVLYNKWLQAQQSGGSKGEFPWWFETAGDDAYSDDAYDHFEGFLKQIDDDEWAKWEQDIYEDAGHKLGAEEEIQEAFHDYLEAMGVEHKTQAEAKQAQWEAEAEEEGGQYGAGHYAPGAGGFEEDNHPEIPNDPYGRRYYSPTAVNPESAATARPDVDFEEHDFEQDPLPLPSMEAPEGPISQELNGLLYDAGDGPSWGPQYEQNKMVRSPGFQSWFESLPDEDKSGYTGTGLPRAIEEFQQSGMGYEWPKNRSLDLYRGRQVDLNKPEFHQIRRMLYGPDLEFEEQGGIGLDKAKAPGQVAPAGGWDNPELGNMLLDALEQARKSGPGGLGKHWSTSPSLAEQFAGQSGFGGSPHQLQVLLTNSWGGQGEDPYRTNTGGDYPDENEITMLNGAPANISEVKIRNPKTKQWHSVLPEPSMRTAREYPGEKHVWVPSEYDPEDFELHGHPSGFTGSAFPGSGGQHHWTVSSPSGGNVARGRAPSLQEAQAAAVQAMDDPPSPYRYGPDDLEFGMYSSPSDPTYGAAGVWAKGDEHGHDNWLSGITWGPDGTIGHVETKPDHQRKGLATQLFDYVKQNHRPDLQHSTTLTADGAGWAAAEQARQQRTAAVLEAALGPDLARKVASRRKK